MKSVVELWTACLDEAGRLYHVRTHRDKAYALARIEDEGLEFLTLTLPRFEKDFLKSLSTGEVGSDQFYGFRRAGGLPAFLQGFLHRVFDRSGRILPNPDPGAIRAIRQILLLCSKIELPCSSDRVQEALNGYIRTDAALAEPSGELLSVFREASRALLGRYLADVESLIYSGEWQPRHSAGALATRESYNSRYASALWTERLQEAIRWEDDLVISPRDLMDSLPEVTVLSRDDEHPCRVITVPKTMKGPRVIAMEPVYNQYVQQGVLHAMSDVLADRRYSALAEYFSWASQDPNRELARLGSIDGSFATLDLSEASDRVHAGLVWELLASTPFLRRVVFACRSQQSQVQLESGTVRVNLNKFSSMGSALCFPIESMVFFIIEAIACADLAGSSVSDLRIRDLPRMRVFGDDLIVPEKVAQTLSEWLEAYGLKVNLDKSFTTGYFRESCGSEWYRGEDVSVFRVRAPLPQRRHHHSLVERCVSLHNRIFDAGWFDTARYVEDYLISILGRVPYTLPWDDVPALHTYDASKVRSRTSPTLHRREILSFIFKKKKPLDPLDGWGALRKFYAPHIDPRDIDHLRRDGRSRCVSTNIGWNPIAISDRPGGK